jgi:ABC-type nitrate/sulfonate/bicarbonate transport system permease component
MAIRGPVEILRPLPAIALVPLMTIAFGLGLAMEVYVVAFAVFWPAIILTQHAVNHVERQLIEVADALELSRPQRIWKIILPAIVPDLVVMLRFTSAIALLIAVTVELVSNPRGLGHEMMMASEAFAPARMLAYLVVITLIGWCLNLALVSAERRVTKGVRFS